jgi:hypothetical protein
MRLECGAAVDYHVIPDVNLEKKGIEDEEHEIVLRQFSQLIFLSEVIE